ncbi:MAG: hypothetical protein QXH27_03785 [Candidatus Micrarchaeia archaeon]
MRATGKVELAVAGNDIPQGVTPSSYRKHVHRQRKKILEVLKAWGNCGAFADFRLRGEINARGHACFFSEKKNGGPAFFGYLADPDRLRRPALSTEELAVKIDFSIRSSFGYMAQQFLVKYALTQAKPEAGMFMEVFPSRGKLPGCALTWLAEGGAAQHYQHGKILGEAVTGLPETHVYDGDALGALLLVVRMSGEVLDWFLKTMKTGARLPKELFCHREAYLEPGRILAAQMAATKKFVVGLQQLTERALGL